MQRSMTNSIIRLLRAASPGSAGLILLAGFCARGIGAQVPTPPSRFAVIEGVAIDSLHQDFLRGARIDHPRESFRPRYTLALAHPAVQEHYRELLRRILEVVPDLGFIHLWTNDSGAGFEFVSSLYAGRNGGPYLIREWKDSDEIARSAAAVITVRTALARGGRTARASGRPQRRFSRWTTL